MGGGAGRCAVAVAVAIRQTLIQVAGARLAGEGQQTKMELVYGYLTGPRFRHRVEAIVERFDKMKEDLDRERKTMTRLWAKREQQIGAVIEATGGMYGDLQGIAGRTLVEIERLELPLLAGTGASAGYFEDRLSFNAPAGEPDAYSCPASITSDCDRSRL